MSENKIKNPILPGFYPDPSICRVEDDFYMVCSSFELYPGIPVFHSKDLAHWEQMGYAMQMENGFHVEPNVLANGVMAPTIRYHKGTFYIINTNFCDRGNYIISAQNPAGPWSEPYWLTDVPGIDASLFFDTDDRAYVIGTGDVVQRADGNMERGIWLCEFDQNTKKTLGEVSVIWDSALRCASSPEAPHIYKKGEWYYLVIAEGGTEHYHAVTMARSRTLRGWYEGNPANPVMTHRQFGFSHPIDNVGHADLVDTPQGNWYAVLLGSRIIEGQHKNLGRETYLCPIEWEREWPVFSPHSGQVDFDYPKDPHLPWTEYKKIPEREDFDTESLGMQWNFWGTPYMDFWRLNNGKLFLKCLARSLSEPLQPLSLGKVKKSKENCVSFVGRRQQHILFEALCKMKFCPAENETAGIVILQASNHQYRLERAVSHGEQLLRLVLVTAHFEVPPHFPGFTSQTSCRILKEIPWIKENIILSVRVKGQHCDFLYGDREEEMLLLMKDADGKLINPEIVGGMVGTMIGMFASGNGKESQNEAAFDWFIYRGCEKVL